MTPNPVERGRPGRLAFIATLVLARGAAEHSLGGTRDRTLVQRQRVRAGAAPRRDVPCDVAFPRALARLNWVLDIGQASRSSPPC